MPIEEELVRRRRNLIDALARRGISLSDISQRTGISISDLQSFYAGNLDAEISRYEEAISQALGTSIRDLIADEGPSTPTPDILPVRGVLRAGAWLENTEYVVEESVPVLADIRYPRNAQFIMQMHGHSMNKLISHGDYVHCVNWDTAGVPLQDEMIVVVQRHRDGLTESTLKQVQLSDRGDICLVSRSHDEPHQLSIILRRDKTTVDGSEVVIQGMVIGRFQAFH